MAATAFEGDGHALTCVCFFVKMLFESGLKLTPGMQDEKNVSGSPAREGSVPHLSQHTCGRPGGNARAAAPAH